MTRKERERSELTALELVKRLSDSQLAELVKLFAANAKTAQPQK